ncbi:MAG: hypothetical protein ACE5OS_12195 [Anaerolineae bacterium]
MTTYRTPTWHLFVVLGITTLMGRKSRLTGIAPHTFYRSSAPIALLPPQAALTPGAKIHGLYSTFYQPIGLALHGTGQDQIVVRVGGNDRPDAFLSCFDLLTEDRQVGDILIGALSLHTL